MNQKQQRILAKLQKTGAYETTSDKQAALAKSIDGVFHVYSTDGKHRFVLKQTVHIRQS